MSLRAKLKKYVDPVRFKHCLSVEKTAVMLAGLHKIDTEKAAIAAILHDCAKNVPEKELVKTSKRAGITIDEFLLSRPKLLHGFVSAIYAKRFFGIRDKGILSAISYHTTGRPNMNKLEKVIFIADHTEAYRRFQGVKRMRSVSLKDLDQAIALISDKMIKYLEAKNIPVYKLSKQTRNYYRNKCK